FASISPKGCRIARRLELAPCSRRIAGESASRCPRSTTFRTAPSTATDLPWAENFRSSTRTPICVTSASVASVATSAIDIIDIFRKIGATNQVRDWGLRGFGATQRAFFPYYCADLSYGRRRPFYNHCQHFF